MTTQHYAILIDSKSKTKAFVDQLLGGTTNFGLAALKDKKGEVLSDDKLNYYINEEERYGLKNLTEHTKQTLISMSSGERKKLFLNSILKSSPDYLILVNPFDNLDLLHQKKLKEELVHISKRMVLILLISRKEDILPMNCQFAKLQDTRLIHYKTEEDFFNKNTFQKNNFSEYKIPSPINSTARFKDELICLRNVSVSFYDKPILSNINWSIKVNEFWQLKGPNGSGKSTLLSLLTGDNQKGYGQEIILFGRKKGSGESVWDIKKNIGYFTPSLIDTFKGYHTLENMLLSGLHDSIGLYVKPTETQKKLAAKWLQILNLSDKKEHYFNTLSTGEKRMVMTARAMIKNPPLLLLDEPTVGLDDSSAELFVSLVNKIAKDSITTIIFVSHRAEQYLRPKSIFNLTPSNKGSFGVIE